MPPVILYYAIPFFVLLLSIEAWFSYKEQKKLYETKDTFTSLGLGIGNVLTSLITKALIFWLFTFLYSQRLFTLDAGKWYYWVLLFFADCKTLITSASLRLLLLSIPRPYNTSLFCVGTILLEKSCVPFSALTLLK